MANWAFTEITLKGSKEQIDLFESKLNTIIENADEQFSDYGKEWLGHIPIYFGLDYKDFTCRGSFTNRMRVDENTFLLSTETAWYPMLSTIKLLVDNVSSDIEIIFTAEESGCGIFLTNDSETLKKVSVDSCFDNDYNGKFNLFKDEWFLSREQIENFGKKHYTTTSLEEIEMNINAELIGDDYINISGFESVAVEDVL